MNRILYYLVVLPISWIPLRILYFISDLIYYLLFYLVAYRKKVVFNNLRNSFPEKGEKDINNIAKTFYQHFSDNLVESVRLFSMSKEEVARRCIVANPEIFKPYIEQQQNIVIVGAHYANWELAALASEIHIPHHIVGLITMLKSPFWHQKLVDSRTRFGVSVINKNKITTYLEENKNKFIAPVFVGDQSPSSAKKKLYWTTFLNQETGVMLGAEKFARLYNYPVLYAYNRRIKRGYYELIFELVESNPKESQEFSITEKHLRLLETEIRRDPPYWLWTHRRWKRKREI